MTDMRAVMRLVEMASQPPGLLAVKARLRAEASETASRLRGDGQADPAEDGEAPDLADDPMAQFGIIDDLWITPEGGLVVHRALCLPQPWTTSLRSAGHPYWSTSTAGAHPYNENHSASGAVVLLTAELRPTPRRNAAWWEGLWETILQHRHVGEDEVRLAPGEPLMVRHVQVDGRDDPASPLIGKTLTS